ncbi:MAG: NERD domain-containing protein [Muribaculaceae bacterium]|nr:hypothetical protein [Bacteroides sp.]MDE6680573.1 NERD domain-containing protein [Muribaculaceae bacterium]
MWHLLTFLSLPNWLLAVIVLLAAIVVTYIFRLFSPRMRHGREGERKVRQLLDGMANKANIPLHDLLLPTAGGHTTQIDHLLISQRGIFVIETKSHYGTITGDPQNRNWRQQATTYTQDFYNPLMQNASHIRHLRNLLRRLPAEWFISVVVFTDAESLKISRGGDGVVVLLSDLSDKLKQYPRIIERKQLSEIAGTVRKANFRNPLKRIKHVFHAQRTAKQSNNNK